MPKKSYNEIVHGTGARAPLSLPDGWWHWIATMGYWRNTSYTVSISRTDTDLTRVWADRTLEFLYV